MRKKRIDAADRLLADGLRLHASRPRPGVASEPCEALARDFLGRSLGLALREQRQILPGPRHGCEIDPPRAVAVEMPDANTIHARGLLRMRDRRGEAELAIEEFRLSARRSRGTWRTTRVLLTSAPREAWEAAG